MTRKPPTVPSFAVGRLLPLAAVLVALGLLAAGVYAWRATESRKSATTRTAGSWSYRSTEYEQAVGKAIAWVDQLAVDPATLQNHGVKGKKKLAEALAVYSIALRYEKDPDNARRFRSRIAELARHTEKQSYHNMRTCDAREFAQNSMSYLRVMWLMQRSGLDTSKYMEELIKAKERFDGHFSHRGAWQRAMFARYYDDFDLEKPETLLIGLGDLGVIHQRLAVEQYNPPRAYQLTHEVFVAFDYGFAPTQNTFAVQDLAYLSNVLPPLVENNIRLGDADLLSELLTAMVLLGLRDQPATKRGIDYLLDHQNVDGTWGSYEDVRARMGDLVDQHLYLHTTLAAIQALLEAYERNAVASTE